MWPPHMPLKHPARRSSLQVRSMLESVQNRIASNRNRKVYFTQRLAQINSPCSTYLISFLTTCVPHKKLIQSAQYNLYRFAGYLKDLGPGTRNWGPRTGHRGAALSIAHNQPKKAKEIFVIFMTPKDTSIPWDNPPCHIKHTPPPLSSALWQHPSRRGGTRDEGKETSRPNEAGKHI